MIRFQLRIAGNMEEWRLAEKKYAKKKSWDMTLPTVFFNLQGRDCVLQRYKGVESHEDAVKTGKILVVLAEKPLYDMECGLLHTFGRMYWYLWEDAFVAALGHEPPLSAEVLEAKWPEEPPWMKRPPGGLQPDGTCINY